MKILRSNKPSIVRICLASLAFFTLLWVGCGQDDTRPTGPEVDQSTLADRNAPLTVAHAGLQAAIDVQARHTNDLMAIDRVVGTAIGADENGAPVLLVLTAEKLANGALPAVIDGLDVVEEVTGEFRVSANQADVYGFLQVPPIELGTSGGWAYDAAGGFCCSGTLGCLIQDADETKYILSNYHVLEGDTVPGANGIVINNGDPVIQPGLADVGCDAGAAQEVATLVVSEALPDGNIDAAIAQVVPGMVDESGSILGIGVPSSETVAAFLGQKVLKSGASTGLTKTKVIGLNGTILVSYFEECAGAELFVKEFTGQIVVKNQGRKFFDFGDSGAVMVERGGAHPRAIGLLYASSTTAAAANPIDEVLAFFGATMVGN